MAKPTTLTPELQQKICDHILRGSSVPKAAVAAGVSWDTVKGWRKEGKAGRQPFADFLDACDHARALCCTRMSKVVHDAAEKGDARPAQWWLEHCDPQFQPRQKHDVTVNWLPDVRKAFGMVRQRVIARDPAFKELTPGALDEMFSALAEQAGESR